MSKEIYIVNGLKDYSASSPLMAFTTNDDAEKAVEVIKEYAKTEPKIITDKGNDEYKNSCGIKDTWMANFPFDLNLRSSYDEYEIVTVNLIE